MLDDMLDDLPIFFRSLLVGFLLIDDLSIFFEGNLYMFVQSRGCTGTRSQPGGGGATYRWGTQRHGAARKSAVFLDPICSMVLVYSPIYMTG
jgi:hypothetical protein